MMDEMKRSEVKTLLGQNERLLESIRTIDEKQLDEGQRTKLAKVMRIQLLMRYVLRLEEKAEGELLEQLDRIAGEDDG